MYIWLGINVDDQLCDLRSKAIEVERKLGMKNSCYTLPMHISLKISFPVSDELFDSIVNDVERIYSSHQTFDIDVKGIENENVIVWIRMKENEKLNAMHDELNELLLKKYGVPLHEYDMDYKFHTTLFMDNDTDKLSEAYDKVKNEPIPDMLRVNSFVIGTSPSGALGTYSVYKEIKI